MKPEIDICLPFTLENASPWDDDNEMKYPESLVRYFLERYTKKGARVFDPFMGLGTTAMVAEEMGRIPYGIEADRKRYEWGAGQIENWNNIRHGDSAKIGSYGFPKMDFAITSPPYMPSHHKWNPLYAGDPEKAGYDRYLKRMKYIFRQLAGIMKKNAMIIVQADNLYHKNHYTPLVRDLSLCIEASFAPKGEIIVRWENPKPDHPYTHCLLFRKI